MDKDAKIYVAGHKGLVGSAISSNLKNKGYTNIIQRTHAELDLLDAVAVKQFFDEQQPEYVILAAAHVGGIMANSRFRADFIWRNLQIQQNVIWEAYTHKVKKLLFLGSTCIYPANAPQPITENALLTSELEYTNEPYAIAKIAGLKLCESFNIQYGTNFIAVMPTNLYGPNDNFHLENSHVLPAMIRKVHLAHLLKQNNIDAIRADLNARPIEGIDGHVSEEKIIEILRKYGITPHHLILWGTGNPLREFLWSEDMADASVYILENVEFQQLKGSSPQIRNCHINIGTGTDLSIKETAQLVKNTIGYTGDLLWDATRPDGTYRKLCDVSRLHQLGWTHKVELDEGISRLYNWYCQSINNTSHSAR